MSNILNGLWFPCKLSFFLVVLHFLYTLYEKQSTMQGERRYFDGNLVDFWQPSIQGARELRVVGNLGVMLQKCQ